MKTIFNLISLVRFTYGFDSLKLKFRWAPMLCFLIVFNVSFSQETIEVTVKEADNGDDAEEQVDDGTMDVGSSDLELGVELGKEKLVGIRFQDVDIPAGSIITKAYIQFMADEAHSGTVNLKIHGDATSPSPIFSEDGYDISTRQVTNNSVNWSPPEWENEGDQGPAQRTSDLTLIVQEIVEENWISGDAMSFIFSLDPSSLPNTRTAEDGSKTHESPVLHIEFLRPGLSVTGNNVTIKNNDVTPHTIDFTDFGNTTEGTPVSHIFTITNNGSDSVGLTGTSNLVDLISGDTAFSIETQPSTSVLDGGESTTFKVKYNPESTGEHTAIVSIDTNVEGESPFTFKIKGSVIYASSIGPGSSWKYLDDGSNQEINWRSPDFDDISWFSGYAEFGFGEGDETTEIADVNQITNYFRKTFSVTAAEAAFSDLTLNANRDDGMVVYINGDEVWRDNMPTGTINYDTKASGGSINENVWISKTISNPLEEGTNVIAVEIHQSYKNSDDVSFDFSLELSSSKLIRPGGEWHYLDDGSDQGITWRIANGVFSLWESGGSELGYGSNHNPATEISDGNITTYFRKRVSVSAEEAANSSLILKAVRDDGMIVYINGNEVWRDNMPNRNINYQTKALQSIGSNSIEKRWIYLEIPNVLEVGDNEIAVEIHQISATNSDHRFNFEMYTSNKDVFIKPPIPDSDTDGVVDYLDSDDDNDGVSDWDEGCYGINLEGLGLSPLENFPYKDHPIGENNTVTIEKSGSITTLERYYLNHQSHSLYVKGPTTSGVIAFEFASPLKNLAFKIMDFENAEECEVKVYDDTGTLIDLKASNNVYDLGTYIKQQGNVFSEKYNGENIPTIGEDLHNEYYHTVNFYFPNTLVSKVEINVNITNSDHIKISDFHFCNVDTDGDGIMDNKDLDSDNDGITDMAEAHRVDTVGNGVINSTEDVDFDGFMDVYDEHIGYFHLVETSRVPNYDFDGDGIMNNRDLDSDNDGIVDLVEAEQKDINNDGQVDSFNDTNNNGLHDAHEGTGNILKTGSDSNSDGNPDSYPEKNKDSSGFPNFMDIDSDNDGITDNTEAQATNAYLIYDGTDTDGDGVLDIFDTMPGAYGGNRLSPVDTDFDGIPDYLDTNSDDDSENDSIEGHDYNGDGIINGTDNPEANNGIFSNVDLDQDGLDDGYDNNTSGFDVTNGTLNPTSHPNYDNSYNNYDWRASNLPVNFDGDNDYVDFGDIHDLSETFSLEAWVLKRATTPSNIAAIISKGDYNSGNERGYHLIIDTSNRPNLTWYDNSGTIIANIISPYPITNNKWYHIAATFDGTTARLYVDGLEVISGIASASPVDGTEKFMIGGMYDSSAANNAKKHFKGYIDEVRIWDIPLSNEQIRTMMNQEILENAGSVEGKSVPLNVSAPDWSNLKGYYPMDNNRAEDLSGNSNNGVPKNSGNPQEQSAPLPYTTKADGNWKDDLGSTPWTYGNNVWNIPNSIGIDGVTPIDWNIVETSHNISIDTYADLGRERSVLGLVVKNNELQVNGSTASGTGNGLTVTHYLKIDGTIDLEGESQLIQSAGSVLDVTSSGTIERDQQGTADRYTYNYWAAPVGVSNTTTNNNNYTLSDILNDGTDPANPGAINFLTSGYNGTSGSPIGIADYWIWKYSNQENHSYSSWQHIRSTGTLLPGEGFTMKGTTNTEGAISNERNYVFKGKPHNGDITLTLSAGNGYLVGNPYASAIDANEFILDNISDGAGRATSNIINGTLSFWDHFASGTHNLSEYQGGYASYTLLGGTVAISNSELIDDTGDSGTKIPGRYIPIGQGFFVTASTGGTITFKNSQRTFKTEASDPSVFMKAANSSKETSQANRAKQNEDIDTRPKIRLMFDSPKGYHRQLLVGVDINTTNSYDLGYDALLLEDNMDDIYWTFDNNRFIIQAVNNFEITQKLPLGIKISEDGNATIRIDQLENITSDHKIYVYDKTLNIYHNLKDSDYEVYLVTGEYLERFEIVFDAPEILETPDSEISNIDIHYSNSINSIILINPKNREISSVELINTLGQIVYKNNNKINKSYSELMTSNLNTGVYIINIKTENKNTFVKKIVIDK